MFVQYPGIFNIPGLGIKGAAISTVIGHFFGMAIGIYFIAKNKLFKKTDFTKLKLEKDIVKQIYKF